MDLPAKLCGSSADVLLCSIFSAGVTSALPYSGHLQSLVSNFWGLLRLQDWTRPGLRSNEPRPCPRSEVSPSLPRNRYRDDALVGGIRTKIEVALWRRSKGLSVPDGIQRAQGYLDAPCLVRGCHQRHSDGCLPPRIVAQQGFSASEGDGLIRGLLACDVSAVEALARRLA